MKKILSLLLVLMLLSFAACGQTAAEPDSANDNINPVVGGWQTAQSPTVTPELRALTDKAFGTFEGARYEPVAYLAHQIVAGTNHRFLCKTTSVLPDGSQTYSIAEIYEDLDGNASIMDIVDSVVPTNLRDGENLSGGWTQPEDVTVPEDVQKALKTTGAQNEPIACVSTQVVAGMNYCLLCRAADADDAYTFIYLYVDLQGNASITDAVRFTDGSDNASRG